MDYISYEIALIFFVISVGFGMLLSVVAVMLEEMSIHIYSNPTYVVILFFAALIENLGYRQLNSWWRITVMYQIARKDKATWGNMKRKTNWKKH